MKKTISSLAVAAVFGGLSGAVLADVIRPGNTVATGGDASVTPVADLFRETDATVFEVNERGVGHYLIIPYFTVQDNQTTAFHITNTDLEHGKAVKVRFRGAGNSDDILDFQVYLSPGDVIGFGLEPGGIDQRLQIFTTDNSCTIPRFDAVAGTTNGDKVPNSLGYLQSQLGRLPAAAGADGTREGYVEIFTMADIVRPGSGTRPNIPTDQTGLVYRASKHNFVTGVASCDDLIFNNPSSPLFDNAMMTDSLANITSLANTYGLDTPSTGLVGDWYIINGQQNTSFSGPAIALEARVGAGGPPGRGNFVIFPQRPTNYAGSANDASNRTSDPLLRASASRLVAGTTKTTGGVIGGAITTPVLTPLWFDFPDMSTPYLSIAAPNGFPIAPGAAIAPANTGIAPENQIQQISRALATNGVMNTFVTNGNFETDWVFSMPTRRYSVAVNYSGSGSRVFSAGVLGVAGARAFFHDSNVTLAAGSALGVDGPRACVLTDGRIATGRDEQQLLGAVSPAISDAINFCGETTVLTFNGSSVLDSHLSTQNIGITPATLFDGWLDVDTRNNGNIIGTRVGLPVVGYAAIKAVNDAFAPTRNFGYTWPHKTVAP